MSKRLSTAKDFQQTIAKDMGLAFFWKDINLHSKAVLSTMGIYKNWLPS